MLWAHQCQKNRLKIPSPVPRPPLPLRRGLGHDKFKVNGQIMKHYLGGSLNKE